jgi:hypothetical protein
VPDLEQFRCFEVFIFDFHIIRGAGNLQPALAAFLAGCHISVAAGTFHWISSSFDSGKDII